jgi:hypothetical protein
VAGGQGLSLWSGHPCSEIPPSLPPPQRFEDFGFDALNLPDHLAAPAPFPALAATAQGRHVDTPWPRMCSTPASTSPPCWPATPLMWTCSATAASSWDSARVTSRRSSRSRAPEPHRLSGARHHLCPSAPPPRAGPDRGNGDHILTPAAQQADIIGLTGSNLGKDDDGDPLGERVAFVCGAAGDRFAGLELNLAVTASPTDNSARGDGEPSQA